jgi:hypothetical protein
LTVHDSNGVLMAECAPYAYEQSVPFTASPSDASTFSPPPPVAFPPPDTGGGVAASTTGREGESFEIDTGFDTMPQYCANITYLSGSSGEFSDESPLDGNYMPMSRCGWLIQVLEGDVIDLTVTRLDLEPGYDRLEVFDATSSFGDPIKIFRCVPCEPLVTSRTRDSHLETCTSFQRFPKRTSVSFRACGL